MTHLDASPPFHSKVSDVPSGLEEIELVADGADALSPPLSWAYWCWDMFKTNRSDVRWGVVSRSYPLRVDGHLRSFTGGSLRRKGGVRVELQFTTGKVSTNSNFNTTIFYAGDLTKATVTVTPTGALRPGVDNNPKKNHGGTHYLSFENIQPDTDVTIVVEANK